MFGSRLKTWMENYIGRPKKKAQAEANKGKPRTNHAGGLILDSSESLAQSDTGISSGSQQVLSSCATDHREGYSTATMDSDRSALIHCHTAVSLPSPESAYSTGYSTDGTSPGATAPPEYYINIRTGKHYFPSPAPTPTSPHSHTAFPNLHSAHPCLAISCPSHPLLRPHPRLHPPTPDTSTLLTSRPKSHLHSPSALKHPTPPHYQPLSTPPHLQPPAILKSPPRKTSPRTHYASLKLFLRSPRDTSKQKTALAKNKPLSPSKSKKWFKQPFQKFAHRRMDPCHDNAPTNDLGKQFHLPNPVSFLPAQDTAASPRQRNRIKTNPWLPRAPTSFQYFHPAFPLASLPRNRSCNNTPLQHRKSNPPPPPFQRPPDDSSAPPTSSPIPNLIFDSTDRSDEDLTLNEVMGTYNESYVYEKETDILSDSDPTDCDDYDTDSDADKGGDERDSHDDELDFIDNAPLTDSDDSFPPNTARSSYHHLGPNKYPFLCNLDRRHSRINPDPQRSLRKGHDASGRRERRKQGGRKCSKCEDEDNEKRSEGSSKKAQIDDSVGGLNLRRVLLKRVMAKNVSRSAEGSAVTGRWGRNDGGRASEGSSKVVVLLDEEAADERYKELMEEADNIFQSLRNSPVIKSRKKMHFLDGNDGRRDQSLETIRKEPDTMCRRQPQPNDPGIPQRKTAKSLVLTLSKEAVRKGGNKTSFKAKSSAHSPLDPLGPTLRNFAVFTPAAPQRNELRTSSSDDSDPSDSFTSKSVGKKGGAHYSSRVPIAFQSVVLGKPLASYCPQSEPVKRKIYSCSKTYDRLVKHLERNPAVFEEIRPGGLVHAHRPTVQPTHPNLPARPHAPPTRLHNSHPQGVSHNPYT